MAEASIGELVNNLKDLLNSKIIPFLFVLATVLFMWGVIQYIIAGGSEDRAKNAKQIIVWGIIGLTIMTAAWAIVGLFCNSFFGGCPAR